MLKIFRICKTKHAATAFDGEGAYRFGGRWNSRGTRIVYAAGSLALAVLEMLVHLQDDKLLFEYSFVAAEIPSELILPVNKFRQLPQNWGESPAPLKIQRLGDDWARTAVSAVVEVPSAIIPLEKNYLLNPLHPDFGKIVVSESEKFSFDPRLIKK